MFVAAKDQFALAGETRARIKSNCVDSACAGPNGYGTVSPKLDPEHILRVAKVAQQKMWEQWADFKGGQPLICIKRYFDVQADNFVEEQLMVQIEEQPFGRGAVRECFRMKEVRMETRVASDSESTTRPHGAHLSSPMAHASSASGSHLSFQAVVGGLTELFHNERMTMWVAKRSTMDHKRKIMHRKACQADIVFQTWAKHYAELFNRAVQRYSHETSLGRCGARDIDFLMTHVVELPDGRTFGAESFMIGEYMKHNTNSGETIGSRTTPQAFSYFTFIQSNRRLMVVDVQGVGDLYTDPVIHFLPSRVAGALGTVDCDLNFALRGFALFLWSHRRSDIDRMLNLPEFALSPHEEKYTSAAGATTISALTSRVGKSSRKQDACNAGLGAGRELQIKLADVHGVDLSDWCDWKTARPQTSVPGWQVASKMGELDLVGAECHLEIVAMYHLGRISLSNAMYQKGDVPTTELGKAEVESATFHLVEAARLGLPAALLALARLTSGMPHDDILPQVVSSSEHRPTCLALLARAASLQSSVAMGALAKLVMSGDFGPRGEEELRAIALHLEAYAEEAAYEQAAKAAKATAKVAAKLADKTVRDTEDESDAESEEDEGLACEQEHTCLYKCSFGWEDHGWTAATALEAAAALRKSELGIGA